MEMYDLLNQIDAYLDANPYWTIANPKLFVVFNNQNHPYLGIMKEVDNESDIRAMGFIETDEVYSLFLYDAQNLRKTGTGSYVAQMYFSKDSLDIGMESQDVYLAKLFINDVEHSKKELGHSLIKILDLFTLNSNKKKLFAFIYPFSYLGNKTSLERFYKNSGFVVFDNEIIKKMSHKVKNETKIPFINFPTKKRDYTVLIPKQMLIVSGFKQNNKYQNL